MRNNRYSSESDLPVKQYRQQPRKKQSEFKDRDTFGGRGEEYVRREKYQHWKYQTDDHDYDE
jgi:hypothetical protein